MSIWNIKICLYWKKINSLLLFISLYVKKTAVASRFNKKKIENFEYFSKKREWSQNSRYHNVRNYIFDNLSFVAIWLVTSCSLRQKLNAESANLTDGEKRQREAFVSALEGTIHILRKHFNSTKLNLSFKFFTKIVFFFGHIKRISFSILHFDKIFML